MIRRKKALGIIAVGVILGMVAVACSSKSNTSPTTGASSSAPSEKGGVYRTAIEDFGFTGAFDPTGEYLGSAWGLYSQLLIRNLVTYKHIGGIPGDAIVPDLATEAPAPTDNGLTYTFTLKPGVKFGPPLSRAITSADVLYAFQRINDAALVAQYGFYYNGVIKGMDGQAKDDKTAIEGIETPDASTIVFHLTAPTGDFLYRVAQPATAPVPPEVGQCFTKAGDYGRDVIASGPYMIAGSDQVDATSCSTIKPIAGFDPTAKLNFVRNPDYDPATDSPEVRSANLDGVSIVINSNTDDIFNKIQSGELDGSFASTPPPTVIQQYGTDPALEGLLHADSGDRTWYITMNLLVPPFDDVNVRKAVNFVVPKAEMLKSAGGSISGVIATHIMPPTVLEFPDPSYNPYPSTDNNGDVEAAKNAMKLATSYDTNGDGVCDVAACDNVVMINRNITPFSDYTPLLQNALAQIGIKIKPRELDTGTAYTTIQTVKNLIPIASNAGWGKDYADPSTFAVLFDSSGISCEGQINYSEIGMTADQTKECKVSYPASGPPPSVDSDIAACNALTDQARTDCWVNFDKKLMEEIVPWVPYRWANALTVVGTSVTKYEFDQFSGVISLAHIAVDNGVDASTLT